MMEENTCSLWKGNDFGIVSLLQHIFKDWKIFQLIWGRREIPEEPINGAYIRLLNPFSFSLEKFSRKLVSLSRIFPAQH